MPGLRQRDERLAACWRPAREEDMCRQYLTFGRGSIHVGSSPVSISRRMSPARRGLRKTWRWPTRRLLGQQPGGEQRLADVGGELAVVAGEPAREVGEVRVVAAPLAHPVEPLEDPARDAAGGIGVLVRARGGAARRPAARARPRSCSSTETGSAGRPPSRATASAIAQRVGGAERLAQRRRRRRARRRAARARGRAAGRCRRRGPRRRAARAPRASAGSSPGAG